MGDLDTLDDVDAEDKAQNRKSLRHHVAKIDQVIITFGNRYYHFID